MSHVSHDVSMARAATGLDMLRLHEVRQDLSGVLAFLMAREDGPPTVVRRPALDCYLLGIGLNVSTIRIDANGRRLRDGTYGLHGVHLVQPNQDADYHFTGKLVNFRLRLSTNAVAQALEQMGQKSDGVELTSPAERSDNILGNLSRYLLRETFSPFPDQIKIDSFMQMLVDRVIVEHATRAALFAYEESLPPLSLRRVMDYIKQSYMNEINLLELSKVTGLSRSHFLRAFKKSVGTPPHAFVKAFRLHKAGEMISQTKLSLGEIAIATGFNSHAHMTNVFRQVIGFAPSELRTPRRYGLPDFVKLLLP